MLDYKKVFLSNEDDVVIDKIYRELLLNKWQFVILDIGGILKVLTKEKSLFEIDDELEFLNLAKEDIYYKTIFTECDNEVKGEDLEIFYNYLERYKQVLSKKVYGGKYFFGSIAVRTSKGFITTIRGKENLDDYTWVLGVDHKEHLVKVLGSKATLNAPLLDYLFENNKKVKVIVHLNSEFDKDLMSLEYAFPGTIRDSIRDVQQSFNIEHHGVFYLFDNEGELI